MRTNRIIVGALALAALIGVSGCSGQPLSTREKGTGIGALLGAGSGAIIGAAVGHPAAGAAIGGGLGAAGGYVVSNQMQNNEVATQQNRNALQSQQSEIERQRRQIQQLQQDQNTE